MSEDGPERRVGELIASKYRLQRLLGAGGMGAVYAAEHTFTKRAVAVKLMHQSFAKSKVLAERFIREAQAPSAIGHPGIVEVLDGGFDEEGSLYLVLEMLQGETLSENDGAMSLARLLEVSRELLQALQAAHEAGFVHRDIKPDNVFLARAADGTVRVKLLDFGVAGVREAEGDTQLTRTGTVLGTPMFMSPEQAKGMRVDQRSDLWAVGAILYDALAGHPPYQGDSYNALIVSIVTREHIPLSHLRPDLPRSVLEVIGRALRKEPEDRYQSAAEMLAALAAIPDTDARSGVVSARPRPPANDSTRAVRGGLGGRAAGGDVGERTTPSRRPRAQDEGSLGIASTRPSAVAFGVAATRPSAAEPLEAFNVRASVSRPGVSRPGIGVRPAAESPSASGARLWIFGSAGIVALVLTALSWFIWARHDPGEERAMARPPQAAVTDPQTPLVAPTADPSSGDPAAAAVDDTRPADTPADTPPAAATGTTPAGEQAVRPLTSDDLTPALAPKQAAIQRCYEESIAAELVAGGAPPGAIKLDVTLKVSSSGAVRGVGIRGDGSAALVACMRGHLLSARFRPSADATELSFPIVFQPTVIGR